MSFNNSLLKNKNQVLESNNEVLGSNREVLGSNSEVLGSNSEVLGSNREVLESNSQVLIMLKKINKKIDTLQENVKTSKMELEKAINQNTYNNNNRNIPAIPSRNSFYNGNEELNPNNSLLLPNSSSTGFKNQYYNKTNTGNRPSSFNTGSAEKNYEQNNNEQNYKFSGGRKNKKPTKK